MTGFHGALPQEAPVVAQAGCGDQPGMARQVCGAVRSL